MLNIKSVFISSMFVSVMSFSTALEAQQFESVTVACFPVSSGVAWIEEANSQDEYNYLVASCQSQGGQVTVF